MDSTYKTNTYLMPLCIISGVTPLNTSFYIGFCFLCAEKEKDYRWMLEALEELYQSLDIPNPTVIITDGEKGLVPAIPLVYNPTQTKHLLCVWHINKNILVNCKPWFDDEGWKEFFATWQSVLYAGTVQKFNDLWSVMQIKYDREPAAMYYLEDEVIRYKTKIIRCYTNNIPHFGNTATSRSESQHARLKRELRVSTGM